jgi:hypothetical protein
VRSYHRCDKSQSRDDLAPKFGLALSKSQPTSQEHASLVYCNVEMAPSSQLSWMADEKDSVHTPVVDDSKALKSLLVEVATAYVSQTRREHTSVQAAHGVQNRYQSRAEGLEQISEDHVTKRHGHGRPSPHLCTSISKILPPTPSNLSNNNINNNNNHGSTTPAEEGSGLASPKTLVQVENSANRDAGAPSGRLVSAMKELQLLLHRQRR